MFSFSQNAGMNGKCKMVRNKSSFLDYYKEMTLEIIVNKNETTIITQISPKRKYTDTIAFLPMEKRTR